MLAERIVDLPLQRFGTGPAEQRQLICEEETHPAIAGSDRPSPNPHQVTADHQSVEVLWAIVEPCERVGLECRSGYGGTLKLADDVGQSGAVGGGCAHAVPGWEEPPQRIGRHRLDLLTEDGERASLEPSQHLHVHPFHPVATGAERPTHHATLGLEALEGSSGHRRRQPEGDCSGGIGERSMGPGKTANDVAHRIGHRLEEGEGDAGRGLDTERLRAGGRCPRWRPKWPHQRPVPEWRASPR